MKARHAIAATALGAVVTVPMWLPAAGITAAPVMWWLLLPLLLVLPGFVVVAGLAWVGRELRDADRRWEADREARGFDQHVDEALAVASGVPDYVPDEWSQA